MPECIPSQNTTHVHVYHYILIFTFFHAFMPCRERENGHRRDVGEEEVTFEKWEEEKDKEKKKRDEEREKEEKARQEAEKKESKGTSSSSVVKSKKESKEQDEDDLDDEDRKVLAETKKMGIGK